MVDDLLTTGRNHLIDWKIADGSVARVYGASCEIPLAKRGLPTYWPDLLDKPLLYHSLSFYVYIYVCVHMYTYGYVICVRVYLCRYIGAFVYKYRHAIGFDCQKVSTYENGQSWFR